MGSCRSGAVSLIAKGSSLTIKKEEGKVEVIDTSFLPIGDEYHIYRYWPIRLDWARNTCHAFLCAHGWQTGWKCGARIYGWTLHIGALKIKFGKDLKKGGINCNER
jgi:hypothetical protein